MKKTLGPNKKLLIVVGAFVIVYFLPFAEARISGSIQEAFLMLSEYARDHVLLCLVPALFIAGAITVFLNQQAVIKYLGPKANKAVAYGVAASSGAILAVCSCTVLPLFKGIYKKGAGLGPAIAFLYSGPAINILTAKVLGWQVGRARIVGAVCFAIVIGFLMHLIFRKEDEKRLTDQAMFDPGDNVMPRKLWQDVLYLASMIGILVFVNWAPSRGAMVVWDFIYQIKWIVAGSFAAGLVIMLISWFKKDELKGWLVATRDFSLQILPLLFGGVLVSGFLLGRPGHEALIPNAWVATLVGGNSIPANFFAAFSAMLMYFATLTEVPILQGLIGSGMGQGPALALLRAGPCLSLPSIFIIAGELGWKKTLVYCGLVVVLSTMAGFGYGLIA